MIFLLLATGTSDIESTSGGSETLAYRLGSAAAHAPPAATDCKAAWIKRA
ncbi:MAG: hypothetical protein Q8K05_03545 [Polaromonas sp.]|nr:hypothetical protein [Polaromonas sp.]MDP2255122.1 hypothetical protein [Polaromonas sp.]